MAWYRTGTVAVTNNSNVITGTGTSWVDGAAVGETFLGPDAQVYEITSIVSGTSLRISPNYKGSTATVQAYAIMPTQGYLRDLAAQAAALVNSYQAVRDGAGAGKFAAGTAAAPSLRGAADENTGLNFPGADILQLITNGVVRLQIAADGTPSGVFVDKLPVSAATQTAINDLAAACVALSVLGTGPDQVPAGIHFGTLAALDDVSSLQVQCHTPMSKPGDIWREYISDTQTAQKFHGFDGVIRTLATESWT
ncbi:MULTISPECIES: hypothetical protein [unclassified Comamonas]|uniref:hypothetical protein n=1 Tax=unclassified Comamonas TaxID=2638500 RepID=UPI001FA7E6F1|nr:MULTISPECIES: hypothetical protein [unclassified Comamonas]UNV89372.1 hypothetical protein MP576_17410 [Comamonas sp. 7D-2evo1]UNV97330.1 hypothetical protein MPZ60_08995 [Comamonas sp. 7D-2]UNV99016.1 hypothetical protein MP579_17415 [Comamonas sp. 7D-2evo2]